MLGAFAGFLLLAATHGGDLSAASGASARPEPCLPRPAGPERNAAVQAGAIGPWDRIRRRETVDFCSRLARAQIQLLARPQAALATARDLGKAWPGRPEPWVLAARAHTRLKTYDQAWLAWQAARERGYDFRSHHALRDYAIGALMNGEAESALEAYRRLVTLSSLWPAPMDRQRLYLEAAAAALRRGPDALDEAAGYLTAVRAQATSTGLRAYVAGMDAWVAHRRGQPAAELPRVDSAEIWHFVSQVRGERAPSHWPSLSPHEAYAAASLLIERYSSSEALELWELYLEGLQQAPLDPASMGLARERLNRLHAEERRAP